MARTIAALVTGSPPVTSTVVAGLTPGTAYTFKVSATNAVGTGPSSAASNAVTPTAPTAPAAPTGVSAVPADSSATVTWTAPSGATGTGTPVGVAANTQGFTFFSSDNVELTVKVLDGRAINGHFWVFYGSLTDVEFTLTVTDNETQAQKVYTNPQGTNGSAADTSAF